jgi:transposase InsO family protein
MLISDRQYQRLMKEYNNSGVLVHAAMKAGIDVKTARKYLRVAKGPQELKAPHTWRTRQDPVEAIWPEAEKWLEEAPELEAKALFEHLAGQPAGRVDGRALRTFQRRVAQWRRRHGPGRAVCFAQVREPGQSLQFDWTYANELEITIAGRAYPHLLAHAVLPYSNWEWAIPCQSESVLSLKLGVQEAYWRLGGLTAQLQTDQSSTATHQLRRGQKERGLNEDYVAMCEHLGVEPVTIAVKCPDQNGDVESAQGHLKRRLKQHLLLRRSRDFASIEEYARFVAKVCTAVNALRSAKLAEETARLRPLPKQRFPEAEEVNARVSCFSTARVKNCAYSLPSRLIGAWVKAQVSESAVSFFYQGELIQRCARSQSQEPVIDYRHVVDSLVRKPGAFARYVYREELFPRPAFRQAYDRLKAADEGKSSVRYLRLLKLASEFGEDVVAEKVGRFLREGRLALADCIEVELRDREPRKALEMAAFTPDLSRYDQLLSEVAS